MLLSDLVRVIYSGTTLVLYNAIVDNISCNDVNCVGGNYIGEYILYDKIPEKLMNLEVVYMETASDDYNTLVVFLDGGL